MGASQDTDVQPVWNDHNVGCPAAVVNTSAAMAAGFGYIGNMAQHNYGYPLWDDDVTQMANTVEAIAMIADEPRSRWSDALSKRSQGRVGCLSVTAVTIWGR